MSVLSIIVAIDPNNAIGKNNRLLCHLPVDLKYFKSVTQGHSVIMGRNTYESLPNGALPNRRNIVLSSNTSLQLDGCELCESLKKALSLVEHEQEVFIVGGAKVYNESIAFADRLYVTLIHHSFEGADTYFPKIDTLQWSKISEEYYQEDERNRYACSFLVYERTI